MVRPGPLLLVALLSVSSHAQPERSPAPPPPEIPRPAVLVSGCLANPEGAERHAARTNPTAERETVAIGEDKSGFVVKHSLGHRCCLKLETSRSLEGGELTLHERLFGPPCRCTCDSTIRFFLGLPHANRVRVETESPGEPLHVAYAGPLKPLR